MDYILKTYPTWVMLAGFLAASFSAGATGVLFPTGAWYRTLAKPSWTPPDRLFPVAWTLLYILISIAAWWVALSPARLALAGLALWTWQIVLNALWTPVFFGQHRIGAGMAVLALLWIVVALTTWTFWLVDPLAGILMAPYLVWVSYAAALNLAIWRMNPGVPRGAPA